MDAFVLIPVLIFSIVVHEVAHAWQARREGDDTADRLGRITFNPIPHLDLVGSLLVPAILYATNTGFLFGWAKPVPVDPSKYRDYVAGDIRVSMAGIVSNLGLALIATLLLAVVAKLGTATEGIGYLLDPVYLALNYLLIINLILAFFNLLPIPPLDGSHVMAHLLPEVLAVPYRRLANYGILLLIGIMYFGRMVGIDVFAVVLWPVLFFQGLADEFIRLWL